MLCNVARIQKNPHQQMVMVLLLWQVGLTANVKLHFYLVMCCSKLWVWHMFYGVGLYHLSKSMDRIGTPFGFRESIDRLYSEIDQIHLTGSEIFRGSAEFRGFFRIFLWPLRSVQIWGETWKSVTGGRVSQELSGPQVWFTYQNLHSFVTIV